ncbi:MAG TPA: hypothetical protein VJZ77_05935 [Blastocatellia bacterium]|nr:hypothetical protein [Blastocatellia bacterium]
MSSQRRGFGQRINSWLSEPEGETFKDGKWRFWFLTLLCLSILNAILTSSIFGSNRQGFIGSITLAVGALVAWLCVGTLHYSDSRDARLARGVSLLDSISLCFVIGHFCFLLWAQGHLLTIQANEAKYEASAAIYNEKAEKISIDNAKIAAAAERIAQEETKRARIENDTIYQARKAAQAGARISTQRAGSQSIAPSLSTSPIELEKPEKPKETSADFLSRWDAWIRAASFGELILAAATLIFIRNRSAKFNAQSAAASQPIQMHYLGDRSFVYLPDGRKRVTHSSYDPAEVGMIVDADYEFPSVLDDVDVIEKRSPSRRQNLTTPAGKDTRVLPKKKDTAKTHASFDSGYLSEGAKRLREALSDISFHTPGRSFKIDIKSAYLWIRQMQANQGTQETIHSAKVKLDILTDAITMERSAFTERLRKFLNQNGFEL